ncbi:transporter substrate-binding domain-containing protein [Thalassotalea sp. G2M2-11]|uniref:substrate-binding periplasmic protein n=1 Tax=Thalassotalea sp. G2M2-11 TaxID=2787627 RepID=UPI0019D025DA|nr:transporter substrate-binding domain-containing protein [Thalassotalea sp. G2M2-11]
MNKLSFIFIFFLVYTFQVIANDTLLFVVNDRGAAPYIYHNKTDWGYSGLIPDVLKELTDTGKLSIRYVSNSRQRAEESLYEHKVDMMMLSEAWLKHPEKVIVSEPIHMHRSFLYGTTPFPENFSLIDNQNSEFVCTRKGYVYPYLQEFLESKRLIRVDSNSQVSMMRMLYKQRCDYLVMNEFNAIQIMNLPEFKNKKLYHTSKPTSSVPLNIVLQKELYSVKKMIDRHIRKLKANGEITRLLHHHVSQ